MFPAAAIVPVVILVVRLLARGAQGGKVAVAWPRPRRLFWGVLAAAGLLVGLPLALGTLGYAIDHPSPASVLTAVGVAAGIGGGLLLYLATWRLLHSVARRGQHRLVYYLAQLSPLFLSSDGTRGGALLLASMALAYRPSCTTDERAFVGRRLGKERRGGAAFGAALALWHALEARAARDAGDCVRASEHEECAWSLFGTVTYMSAAATPVPVRRVAEEFLALDSARRGQWGGIAHASESFHARTSTPARRAMVAYLNEKLKGHPRDADDAKLLAALRSPVVGRMFARVPRETKLDAAGARAWANRTYVALARREPVSPRAAIAMLSIYDSLLHPQCPDTLLPPEVRDDEAVVESVHDAVAESLAEVLVPVGVPLAAIGRYGPISARVHARIETQLLQELARSLKSLDERYAAGTRLDARGEWLETSLVRGRFRRIQYTLGEAAATRLQQGFAFSYGNLGVAMTKAPPQRRPLSHAIFNVLHGEAVKCGNQASITLQARNMSITQGPR